MKPQNSQHLQLLVLSPDLDFCNRVFTVSAPVKTIGDLKKSLLISNPTSIFLSFNGKTLDDDTATIDSYNFSQFSTLTVHVKLLGGGGDGGATGAESRDCYLNMYAEKKPDKVDPNEQRLSKWTTCALSAEPLKPPCVIDRIGNVFNKEALVRGLIGKSLPKAFRHVRGLKDMITVHLSEVPGGGEDGVRFQCPISGLEFNGKYKFVAIAKCGHVLSAKALKEVKSSACLVCHVEFEESDKLVINGSDEEVAALREKLEAERMEKLKVKDKKKSKRLASVELDASASEIAANTHSDGGGNGNERGKKRYKAVDFAPPHADKKVYASIFTSSRKSDFKETYSCRSLPLGRN